MKVNILSNTVQEFNGELYYLCGGKFKNGGKPNRTLHRVVWEHHNGTIPKGYYIRHKNGNRHENDIENLEMISQKTITSNCVICNKPLTQGDLNNDKIRCPSCTASIPLMKKMQDENLRKQFKKEWPVVLIKRFYNFLCDYQYTVETQNRFINKVIAILKSGEDLFNSEGQLSLDWLSSQFASNRNFGKASFLAFLEKENILPELAKSEDELMTRSIENLIDRFPENFRKLMTIYYRTRLDLRKRHLKNNSRRPLKLITIKTDLEFYYRFAKWITSQHPEIESWETLQEEVVNEFLLTLARKHREIVRKDLHMLFRIAFKKRIIAHIPIANIPSREYQMEPNILTLEQQRDLVKVLQGSIYTNPTASLIGFLAFIHGLSSSQIANIKLESVDPINKVISQKDRPPVYLDENTLLALNEYAKERANSPTSLDNTYLITLAKFNPISGFKDKPVGKSYIRNKVVGLTGYTPKILKLTCYHSNAALYGPQYLIEAFGLSLTQSSRYGNFEEFLVEEELKKLGV